VTLTNFLDRRFTLVTGKGGVGKSTVTAILALLHAAAGRRTLVCELNALERVPALLGYAPVGPKVTVLERNLAAVNIEPAQALEEYAQMKLRSRTVTHLVFDNPLVRRFVEFVPGMNDLLMFGKAFNHERERDEDGRPVWDSIIVDAPATGHGVSFFRLPKVIQDAVPAGNMHDEASAMWDLLRDPRRTAIHLVALPEELPVQETIELHAKLRDELGLPLGCLVINMMPPTLLGPAEAAAFARLEATDDPVLRPLWAAARIRLGREALAAGYAERLGQLGLPLVKLPTVYSPGYGRPEIETLAAAFGAGAR
jgi:anion-transporting  ArsA/GET3 family ATPase